MKLTLDQVTAFAELPLQGLRREFPNMLAHVINDAADLKGPRELHPAFYGCFDWHSAVHGHWMLVRLLKRYDLPQSEAIRTLLREHFTEENIRQEAAYFRQPNRQSFERMYGWAWLLKLALELRESRDPEMKVWSENLRPLEDVIVDRYLAFLSKRTYPIRTGLHSNTAFGLTFALDYARAVGNQALESLVTTQAKTLFLEDRDYPVHLEPSGADFLSPSLIEADLMRRVLPLDEFPAWFNAFIPDLGDETAVLRPAEVSDRSDPQIGHLDGLNLSRAWCMSGIANSLPAGHAKDLLNETAKRHAEIGLQNVATGDYAGEHWLATFAVYLTTED